MLLDEAWEAVAGGVERPAWEVAPAGLPSRFRAGELAVACVGAALLAAAALVEQRDGGWPAIGLHPGQVGAAVVSERHFRIGGRPAGPGFAPLSRFWRAGDGWVRTHANYPWHRAALLEVLGASDDPPKSRRLCTTCRRAWSRSGWWRPAGWRPRSAPRRSGPRMPRVRRWGGSR